MGFILQRRGLLVTGGIVALLVLTVLLSHGTTSGSLGDGSARWWSSLGVEAPSWGGPTFTPGNIVCPQVQDHSATTLDNAFVTLEEGGQFVGRETRYLRGLPGYSLFENVYTMSGMMVAVTSDPSSLPPVTKVMSDMSRGTPENPFPVADETRWLVLSPAEAATRLNRREAARLVGTTVFINDGPGPEGYLAHYFHLAAELFAGAWRVLAAAPDLMAKGTAMGMEFPRRVILGKGQDWRDVPGLNAWFMATMFPMMAVEDSMQWNDRSLSENLYIFDQIVILDRWASHRHNPTTGQWNKMNADVFRVVDAPADWWAPVRQSMMRNLGIQDPNMKEKASVVYISRQAAAKRRLTPEAHSELIAAIRDIPSVELHVPQMELMSKRDQMRLVSQADVVIGVHGNGLTNEIWMKPGGAVIEIFDVGGFTRDYQLLTEPLHHSYFPIWNDKVYDWAADVPGFKLSDNFQSTTLSVSAPLIRGLIEELLEQKTVDPNRPAHLDRASAAHLDEVAAASHPETMHQERPPSEPEPETTDTLDRRA